MAEQCGADVPDDVDEYSRDERIETIYQGWGAREMAERIVELEDELGANVDGVCTGMHADVAEAHAEIERLTSLVGYWEHRAEELKDLLQREYDRANSAIDREEAAEQAAEESREEAERLRSAWRSARSRAAEHSEYYRSYRRAYEMERESSSRRFRKLVETIKRRDRYRSAWLSARRRAADEANFGMEALALRDEEIRRLRAEQVAEAPKNV